MNLINVFPDDRGKILQDIIAIWEKETGETLEEGDAEKLIFEVFVGSLEFFKNFINANSNQVFTINMAEQQLDAFGNNFGVGRLGATPAKIVMRFKFFDTLSIPVILYSNTYAYGTNNNGTYNFRIEEDVVVPSGVDYFDVEMVEYDDSELDGNNGEDANYIEAGSVTAVDQSLYDYSNFLESVENISKSYGGYNNEPDDDYRARLLKLTGKFSTAGTKESYEYFCKNADRKIAAVNVVASGFYIYVYILPKNWNTDFNLEINGVPVAELFDLDLTGLEYDDTSEGKLYIDYYLSAGTYHIYLCNSSTLASGTRVCGGSSASASGTMVLAELNGSGVSGTVDYSYVQDYQTASSYVGTVYEQVYSVDNLLNPTTGYSSVRPINDVVTVEICEKVDYIVSNVAVKVYNNSNVSLYSLKNKIRIIVDTFIANSKIKLGMDIVISQLERYIQSLDGVKQVTITIPTAVSGRVNIGSNQVGFGTFSQDNIVITLEGN